MSNPFGDCSTCAWCTADEQHDTDGDTWHYWKCWRVSGAPEVRLATTTDKRPPACECHLKGESDAVG